MDELKNKDTKKRWSIFPITHPDLWDMYKATSNQHWVAEEVDLSHDKFDSLTLREQDYLKNLLAFFAVSDGLVIENLATNFMNEVDILEAQYFYGEQTIIEQVHAEMYSLLIDSYIKDRSEQITMFEAIDKIETVKKKAEWALNWIDHPSFVHRLIAFAAVEGLAFSSTFAGIFYFRQGGQLSGLMSANEFIMRDENAHYEFAKHLYLNYVKDEFKLDKSEIKKIFMECYEVEKTFVEESLSIGFPGLTKDMMIQYVQFVTDSILQDFGIESQFNVSQPLKYMDRIALKTKTNFFERRESIYTRIERIGDDMFTDDF